MITNIIETIDQYASTMPDKPCYSYGDKSWSYGELQKASDSMARFLGDADIPDKAPVIVYGGQTFEMIATFLGCVKAGHAYIPIDTHSPNERILQINGIAKPAAILAVESLPIKVPEVEVFETQVINDALSGEQIGYDHSNMVSGDENYYIIFTSGTTGVPKGVQISHDNLLSYVNWTLADFGLLKGVSALSQAPYSFDLSVMDLYPTLALGGHLVALPRETTENFKELFAVLPNLGLNEWVSTPSFIDICLLEPHFDAIHYPTLTHFLFCGEELTHNTANTLLQRFPDAAIFNTYGPTEATVAVTQIQITAAILDQYPRLPIGYCKADTKMWVVNEEGNPVAPNEEGELYISGPSVSKGYLNNPEKSAKAFFDDHGVQSYRTGDIGTIDEQGLIFYRGRTDFQIKLHGYRIELEDVDHNLNQVSLVKQATTVPRFDKNHKVNQIIAYVVAEQNQFDKNFQLTDAIKKELSESVMSYMIPGRFVYRDNLPLTANGKVDRKALIAEVNPS